MNHPLFNVYQKTVLKHPWPWMLLLIIGCALSASYLPQLRLDASADSLMLEDDQALAVSRDIAKRYGGGDFLVVTYRPHTELFERSSLNHLDQLHKLLSVVDDVQSVTSIMTVPLLFSPATSFSELASNTKTLRDADIDLELAKAEFLQENPFYKDLLLGPDGQTTALLVTLKRDQTYFGLLNQRNDLSHQHKQGLLDPDGIEQLKQIRQEFDQYKQQQQVATAKRIETIRNIIASQSDEAEIFLGGASMITNDVVSFIRADIQTFGIGVLLFILITLLIIFRQPRWAAVSLLCCALAVLYTSGGLGFVDWPISVISSNYVSLLLIITMSITIHLIVRYRELQQDNPNQSQAWLVAETTRHMAQPSIFMILTTMVGFTSLIFSGIRPVMDFGITMALGILVALVISYLVFPAFLTPLKKSAPGDSRDMTQAFTLAMGNFTQQHLLLVIVGMGMLVLFSVIGMSRLTVENRFIDYFQKDTEIYQGMVVIDQQLGGTTPLDIIINAPRSEEGMNTANSASSGSPSDVPIESVTADDAFDDSFDDSFTDGFDDSFEDGFEDGFDDSFADGFDDGFSDGFEDPANTSSTNASAKLENAYWFTPQRLAQLGNIEQWLNDMPEVGKVLSLATTYRTAAKLNGADLSYVQLMLLANFIPENLRNQMVKPYLSDDGNQVRISVRIIDSDPTLNRNELLERIETGLTENFDLQAQQVQVSGVMVLYNNMLQSLFDSQIKSLGLVFAAILTMLCILQLGNIKLAIITLAPSIVSAFTVLGFMGWIGLPLDLMTITIASISVGIAVDDSIHYVHRFREEFGKDQDYVATMLRSHGSVGKAMLYTSITIIAGFSILVLSNFNPTVYFGLLTGAAMAIALVSNLTLLPALLVSLKPNIRPVD